MDFSMRWMLDRLRSTRIQTTLTVLGFIVYGVQAWWYANNQDSILDEGAYLYKGYLFVSGKYHPYQDYGPWTNHMPLAFLIPGLVQFLFGPGIHSGRYFAILLGIGFLAALWITTKRLGGQFWPVIAIWIVALNPATIKMYSVASSQVLSAFLLMTVLAFSLGNVRDQWKLMIASVLAAILMLTRINMSPVLPLLIIYIFWQHGKRLGIYASLIGIVTVLVFHAVFWPGILKVWAAWLPQSMTPFLAAWRAPETTPFWNPTVDLVSRLVSFFQGYRSHFIALTGFVGTAFFFKVKNTALKTSLENKSVAFLMVLFSVLFIAHFWAALTRSYCVFCYTVYLSFFDFIGILVMAATYSNWKTRTSPMVQLLGFTFLVLVFTGILFSAADIVGESLLNIQTPRLQNFQVLPGSIPLWGLLNNRFGLPYKFLLRFIPTVVGGLVGVMCIAIFFQIRALALRRNKHWVGTPLLTFLSFVMIAGGFLSPTKILGGGYVTYDCHYGVMDSYKEVGESLELAIPSNALVYWQGVLSPVPLLYLSDINIFPAQINLDYSYRLSGEPNAMERYGLWGEELAREWIEESDYVIVAERYFDGWVEDILQNTEKFTALQPTQPVSPCDPQSFMHVFKRIQ